MTKKILQIIKQIQILKKKNIKIFQMLKQKKKNYQIIQ